MWKILLIVSVLLSIIIYFLRNKKIIHLQKQLVIAQLQLFKNMEQQQILVQEINNLKTKFEHDMLMDSLTGLPGRQVFEDRLIQALNLSQRYHLICAVVFLNLDGFKVINDAVGHDVGDELLREVAVRLKNSIRQVDTVSRFAGDEFLFILTQLSKAEAAAYAAHRLLSVVSQPFKVRNQEFFLTASIGIATYPADGEEGKVLLKNAATAVNQAKAKGRNKYQFYQERMHLLSERELILSSSLQKPDIFNQFLILYQPEIKIETNKTASIQALLQWSHPALGFIEYAEFVRLAENNGRIAAITEWFLRNILRQFHQWQTNGFHLSHIGIIISTKVLEDPHFIYKLSHWLQENRIDTTNLILEISVSLLDKIEQLEKSFKMLKHIGIQIAIRDFGTGSLSLQGLKRLPIDFIKIAASLTQDMIDNPESRAIVKMIIALAESLQINVIAEGVHLEGQKQSLLELGCTHMQGRLFGSPVKAEEFGQPV